MTKGIFANTEAMNSDGKDVVLNTSYYEDELKDLNLNVSTLMGMWSGPAATEFNRSYDYQKTNLDDFRALLNELGENISSASNILNETEEERASAASHLI